MGRAPEWLMSTSVLDVERLIGALPKPVFTHLPRDASANKDSSRLPLFSATFDELSELIEGVPTQDLFGGYYLHKLKDAGLTNEWKAKEMAVRARRNHPSFLREYHLLVALKESLPEGFNLVFDNEYDRIGLDFVVEHGEKRIGIRSYVNTYNSHYMSNIKKKFRQPKHDMPTIDLVIDKSDANEINGYWVYPLDAVESAVAQVVALATIDT